MRSCLFATESECETASDGEHGNETGEEDLHVRSGNAELSESDDECEDPDRVANERAEEVRGANVSGLSGSHDNLAHEISNNSCDNENKSCDDDVREVSENVSLEEVSDCRELKDVERGYEEHDDDEPLYDAADEGANVKLHACAVHDIVYACGLKSLVDFESADDLIYGLADNGADDPTDDKDNDREQKARNKIDEAHPDALQGVRKSISPACKNIHTAI